MIYQAFAVFDEKAGAYARPFFFSTLAEGVRAFATSVMDRGHPFALHPADYTLFHLGSYDDASGKFDGLPTPKSLGTALEHKPREDQVNG